MIGAEASLERVVAGIVERIEHRFHGKYRGFVVDNEDPAKLGRLRLRVPSVLGRDVVTGWAMPCVPYGGAADQGLLFLPDRDAGVWVEFEEGDLEFPIWVGTFWSRPGAETELPRPNDAAGTAAATAQDPATRKIIKTAKGHTLQFEDAGGKEAVLLHDGANKHVLSFDGDGISLVDGRHQHEIRLTADGIRISDGLHAGNTVELSAAGIVIQDAHQNKIVMGSGGIQIGEGATQALVLGTALKSAVTGFITALNTHTHLGNLGAPTSPPSKPMTLDVPLSTTHKVR